MVTMSEIKKLADRIAEEFKPDRIILFGSYADGVPDPDSDVDLLVLTDHDGKGWEYAARIRDRIRPPFPLDLIIRRPEQLRKRLADGDPFLSEIVERGEVLYEADH